MRTHRIILKISNFLPFFFFHIILFAIYIIVVFGKDVNAQDTFPSGYTSIDDEGTVLTKRKNLNFVGAGVSCADDSVNKETDCTIGGGSSGNSFETISVPAGTNPVADSSTDTLTLTESAGIDLTGTAGTDTIAIAFDSTEINGTTWGDNSTSPITWTFDISGTNPSDFSVDPSGYGIGTTNPLTSFHVKGASSGDGISIERSAAAADTELRFYQQTPVVRWTFHFDGASPEDLYLYPAGSGQDLILQADETPTAYGNVGIGTETPGTRLEVSGVVTSDGFTMGNDENLTIGSDTFTFSSSTSDFEASDDLTLIDTTPHLQLQDSNGDDFELWADGDQVYLSNVTDGIQLLRFNSLNQLFLRGGSTTYAWPTADGTNGQFLTTNGSGLLTWTTSSGSGDVTSVGDCASGACFDGTQGTIFTFNNASGDQTISFDNTTQDFEISNDITLTEANPHLQFIDSTASSDDYEFYADGNQFYFTNVTDGLTLFRFDISNFFRMPGSATNGDVTWDRTNSQLNIGPYNASGTILGSGPGVVITSNEGPPASFAINAAQGDTVTLLFATSNGDFFAPTASSNNDGLSSITSYGYSGTTFLASTAILSEVDGAAGASDMPGRIIFRTTLDGAASTTERMRINNSGNVTVGSSGLNLAFLGVDGIRDEIQFLVQGNATQTSSLAVFENSGGTDQVTISNTGTIVANALTMGSDEFITLGSDTIELDGTTGDFEFSDDANFTDTTPHIQWIDSTVSEDDFEAYAEGSNWYLTNVTDNIQLLQFDSSNNMVTTRSVTIAGPSLKIPVGSNPSVDENGEIAIDTTDNQLLHGSTPRVIPYEFSKCALIENLAASDDNLSLGMFNDPVTVTSVGVHCDGTCTTAADIDLSDRAGNAMTHGSPVVSTGTGGTTFIAVTANNTLGVGEGIEFSVANAVSPETDEYTICFTYTVDRQ